ncbi:MAG: efflux RND transporter periplasmic adaptor subunit [Gemmatimonadales bacterium]
MTDSPFGRPTPTGRPLALRIGVAAVALVAVLVVVRAVTRKSPVDDRPASATVAESTAAGGGTAVHLSDADQRRIGVTFATATEEPLQREVRTVAQVTFDETRVTTFALKIDGWIEALYVNSTGQPVRRGEPLLSIYSPMLVAAEQELLLARRLGADVATGSTDARAGAADLHAASIRRLQQWDVRPVDIEAIERDGAAHRTMTFVSPVSGVVLEKTIVKGQRVMAGDALYRIVDLATVWLDGEVFERDLPAVKLGQEVSAEFPSLPGETRQGRITFIYPTLNVETRTARVRVELANPGLQLKPGMDATIRFVSTTRHALTVPRASVLVTGERNLVFVRDTDGRFVPRVVVLGVTTDDRAEILSGLNVGEVVVASGTFLVDAESNLDKALGGMGDMPGMDMKAPKPPAKPTPARRGP